MSHKNFQHTVPSTTLGDLLERILDKGVVISGDIKLRNPLILEFKWCRTSR